MIISRIFARKRLAGGKRPSFHGAWGLVAIDIFIIAMLLAALWNPALTFVYVMGFSVFWTILFLMVLIFAPLQIVIIVSTIWAVRSRWEDKDEK